MFAFFIERSCILLAVLFLLIIGCGKDNDFNCPSCDENITWNSYGDFEFEESGDDSTGWKLESKCGWSVYNGHQGGYGDTLELSSCGNNGVIFVWAYQTFHAFRVSEGWNGKTDKGIGIGDSLNVFLANYPDFLQTGDYEYTLSQNGILVEAKFNEQEKLVEMIVGYYFRY